MPPAELRAPGAGNPAPDLDARLSAANAVFTLSLILTQASSPSHLIRLVTTAIPSIVNCRQAVAWHPREPGDYYERAPGEVGDALAAVGQAGRIALDGSPAHWVFPLMSRSGGEPVFLVVIGARSLSAEDIFLLSVLAQLSGTVIARLELIAAERVNSQLVADLNAELESTVSTLTKIMEIHHRLNDIAVTGGPAGIARTLHQLTGFGVLILDEAGRTQAAAGEIADGALAGLPAGERQHLLHRLQAGSRPVYHGLTWLALASPRDGSGGIIALADPLRAAGETELAALQYAATVLSAELARQQSVAQAELRSQADRDRDIARARAAELTASEARQRAILEAALDAVVSIDQFARVTYVNSAFEDIFGYRADEVTGRELGELIVPPSLREAHRHGFARHLATGERRILNQRLELTAMRADGTEFPAEVTVTRTDTPAEPAFTGYVRDITERKHAEQELLASRVRLVAASDQARRRVTRDLHDGAQQRFVTALINLQLAEQKWDSAPDRARELVSHALADARHGLEDLREIVAGIHPEILTQRGLAAALDALAARLPLPVRLDVPGTRLPAAVEASVYFFCTEALTNVVRHARATSAWVRVGVTADRCSVEVGDDGTGGARARSEVSGLTGLRDRIGALHGTVQIVSPDGGGTVLRADIPLSPD